MGFRIRKKIKIFPGVSINLSKSGASLSVKVGSTSWNSRTGKTSVDLPGPFSYHLDSNGIKGLTKAELVEIAKQHSLSGYSRFNKAELIEFLKQHGAIG